MKSVVLVAPGDGRLAANQAGWQTQKKMEELITDAFRKEGWDVKRAHGFDAEKKHGFIDSQIMGIEVFRKINPESPIIIPISIWQFSSHVLPGLIQHRGKILTIANWSPQFSGLVGTLNLNASLTKTGVSYSTIWSENFDDEFFLSGIREWLEKGKITHDLSHAKKFGDLGEDKNRYAGDMKLGKKLAKDLREDMALMGVFDEGCMGMYNAIIPDELLFPLGIFKERLSQSALFAKMREVSDSAAEYYHQWLRNKGMRFNFGNDEKKELTERQVLEGLKMYDALVRFTHNFGCSIIGLSYQLGLIDLCVSSDLAEGLLNNPERPPVKDENGRILFEGEPVVCFNEADECAGLDALITNKVWREFKLDPSTTLHDVRWGEHYKGEGVDEFVWLFEISGAVPPNHLVGGYEGAVAERQSPMFFKLGGATIKGVCKPGEIVWSRIHIEENKLKMDIGRGCSVELSPKENERRWSLTNPEWPIMNAILYGVSQNQLMAKHKSNHIQVVYAPNAESANHALFAKIGLAIELGIEVNVCGTISDDLTNHQDLSYKDKGKK